MEVQLKDQSQPVTVPEVETDDEKVLVGKNNSGKTFVARKDRVGDYEPTEPEPYPARHRFRIYLREGGVLAVIDPAFEEVQKFYTSKGKATDTLRVRLEGGPHILIEREDILTILSATPQDQASAEAAAN